jgi:hypothetical protein
MLETLHDVVHLPPPDAAAPIRMDRFSPNFTDWRVQGFTEVSPMPAYRHVLPFTEETLAQAAYYFRYDHPQLESALERGRAVAAFVAEWQTRSRNGTAGELRIDTVGSDLAITDTRWTRDPSLRALAPVEAAVVMACDRPVSVQTALARARALVPSDDEPGCGEALSSLLERRVVARNGSLLVTLACMRDDARRAMRAVVTSEMRTMADLTSEQKELL